MPLSISSNLDTNLALSSAFAKRFTIPSSSSLDVVRIPVAKRRARTKSPTDRRAPRPFASEKM